MNIISFNYKKADGKVSARTLAVSAEPTKLFAGTDISSLSQEDQAAYINAVAELKDIYLEAVKAMNDKFDLNHNYRQFKPENMTDIVREVFE